MNTVILAPEVFRVVISSALEAYAVPHGAKRDATNHVPLETIGTLWGYESQKTDHRYIHLVAADVETSANRKPGSVLSKIGAQRVKTAFYNHYNPELNYLGEFHSHPWSQDEPFMKDDNQQVVLKTARNVEENRLYRYSGQAENATGDFGTVAWAQSEKLVYRVGLVATVYEMANVVSDPLHGFLDEKSAIRFTYNGANADGDKRSFRCWIKAYVFLNDNTCRRAFKFDHLCALNFDQV